MKKSSRSQLLLRERQFSEHRYNAAHNRGIGQKGRNPVGNY
jgi:hypothetical protein